MSIPIWTTLPILWFTSLMTIATVWHPRRRSSGGPSPNPGLSGLALWFRVEGLRGEVPIVIIVIRVNGEWVEAENRPRNPVPLR
jgi:hypothetical protein